MSDLTVISRIVVFVLAVFLEFYSPREAHAGEPPRLSGMINDAQASLDVAYVNDLGRRLSRFNERIGYAIVVVVISSGEDENISTLIAQLFANNKLEEWGSAGTVLILITVQEGWVI